MVPQHHVSRSALVLLLYGYWPGHAQDRFLNVTSPASGDVYETGEEVQVGWDVWEGGEYFDVSLLLDGNQEGDLFCDGGCYAPEGSLVVTLPTGLESGGLYTFLVGDRVGDVSTYGESEMFQIISNSATSSKSDDGEDDATATSTVVEESTDAGLDWPVILAAVAGGLVLASLCFMIIWMCRKDQPTGTGSIKSSGSSKQGSQGSHGEGSDYKETSADGEGSVSGGAGLDANRLSSLAELGSLSPVHEEQAAVVTKNPMISAIANGAQFHSASSGSIRFHSNGGMNTHVSNSESITRYMMSVGGESSIRGLADDDEEGGGMFADADVVAVLAAAAAQGMGRRDRTMLNKSKSSTPKWDGSMVKSSAWNKTRSGSMRTAERPLGIPRATFRAEEKSVETAGRPVLGGADSAPLAEEWMVSTRESFSSRNSEDVRISLESAQMEMSVIAQRERTGIALVSSSSGAWAEEKVQEAEGTSTAAAGERGDSASADPRLSLAAGSTDSISGKSFGRTADVVPSTSTFARGHITAVSEPECEVPKPASSSERPKAGMKQDGNSWFLASSRSMETVSLSKNTSPRMSHPARRVVAEVHGGERLPAHGVRPDDGGSAPFTRAETPLTISALPAVDGEGAEAAQAPKHAAELAPGSAPSPDHRSPVHGVALRRTAFGEANRMAASTTAPAPKAGRVPIVSNNRGSHVSQMAHLFERITPNDTTVGGSSSGSSRSSKTSRVASKLSPAAPMKTLPSSAPAAETPTSPAHTPRAESAPDVKSGAGEPPAPEEMLRCGESTPVATPDRLPRERAPDSCRGGNTPECTAVPGALRSRVAAGSPVDERHYAWHLESPAGVDGMPSPNGSSDIRKLAIGKKGGRIIPAILGANNTPVTGGVTVVTPVDSAGKGGAISIGPGPSWDTTLPVFGTSQVAAFVADARAEAAAEARAAMVDAQAQETGGGQSATAPAPAAAPTVLAKFPPGPSSKGDSAITVAPSTFATAEPYPSFTFASEPPVAARVRAKNQAPGGAAAAAAAAAVAAATEAAEADAAAEDAAAAAAAAKEAALAEDAAAKEAAVAGAARPNGSEGLDRAEVTAKVPLRVKVGGNDMDRNGVAKADSRPAGSSPSPPEFSTEVAPSTLHGVSDGCEGGPGNQTKNNAMGGVVQAGSEGLPEGPPLPRDGVVSKTMARTDSIDNNRRLKRQQSVTHHAASGGDKRHAPPRRTVSDVVLSAAIYGDEDEREGVAEREAREVQALVAEALALVKEASEYT